LLPVGFAMRGLLPAPRWALTPPFHPCFLVRKRSLLCGTFRQVALPGRYPAPLSCGVRTFLEAPKGPPRSPSLPRPSQIELRATPVNRPIYTISSPKYLWGGRGQPNKSESLRAHGAMPRQRNLQTKTRLHGQRAANPDINAASSQLNLPDAHGRKRKRKASRISVSSTSPTG